MAILKPKFNQVKFFKSQLKVLDIYAQEADDWLEWEGVFGSAGEMVDGVAIGQGIGEAKARIQKIIDDLEAEVSK